MVRQDLTPILRCTEVPYGRGMWITTEDFQSRNVREVVAPYLGKADEIRYRFGRWSVMVRCVDNNPNEIQIYLQTEESRTRVW